MNSDYQCSHFPPLIAVVIRYPTASETFRRSNLIDTGEQHASEVVVAPLSSDDSPT